MRTAVFIVILVFALGSSVAAFEPGLQTLFDDLGYSVNVYEDEIRGDVFFQVQESYASIEAQYASLQRGSALGWYYEGVDPTWVVGGSLTGLPQTTQLGDIGAFFGLALWTNYNDQETMDYTWYSEDWRNVDLADHMKVYRTRVDGQLVAHSYLLAWEDLPASGGGDYNDMVVRLDGVQAVQGSAAPIPEPATMLFFGCGLLLTGMAIRHARA